MTDKRVKREQTLQEQVDEVADGEERMMVGWREDLCVWTEFIKEEGR